MRRLLKRLAQGLEESTRPAGQDVPYRQHGPAGQDVPYRQHGPAGQDVPYHHHGPAPTSNTGDFEYSPLRSPSSFRILKLRRSLGEGDGTYNTISLQGSLVEASLDNPPKYFALSYTWGDPTLCESILLDGRVLRITANCASALRRMLRGKLERLIWVDSICINQATTPAALAERGAQVAMMDRIYRAAEQVNVHLGEGDAASDVACEALKSLTAPYLGAKAPGPQQAFFRRKYESLADDILVTNNDFPYGKLHGIFRLPWFRRTWVVQEVVLARNVVFYCGKHMMHLKTMVVGADFTRLPYSKVQLNAMSVHWRSYLEWHDALQEFVKRREQGEQLPNLTFISMLIIPGLTLEATRPEDKVYGLYGVCKVFGMRLPVPDYQKPLSEVYTEAARAVINHDQSLELLLAVNQSHGWEEYGLPSWVPNLAGCIRRWSPANPPHLTVGATSKSRISGDSKYEYMLEQGATRLLVKGRRLGLVVAAGMPWMTDASTNLLGDAGTPTGQFIGALLDCIGTWYDVARSANPHADNATVLRAMIQTLLLVPSHGTSDSSFNGPIPAEFVTYMSVLVMVSKSGQDFHNRAMPLPLAAPHDNGNVITIGNYYLSVGMHAAIMRIFIAGWKTIFRVIGGPSESGEHLAIGSHSTKEDDIIAVFSGSPSAAVLRPYQDGYRYVGPATVDGVMNGEFWDSGSDVDDEWFMLI